jgi:hypothetical protein
MHCLCELDEPLGPAMPCFSTLATSMSSCFSLEPIGCTVLRRRTSCASLFCREHCDAFRFDAFRFDAFRFTTGRSLDSYAHSKAFSDTPLHRIFCCDSIDTLNLAIICFKLFDLRRFDAFRCVSVFFAALLAALSVNICPFRLNPLWKLMHRTAVLSTVGCLKCIPSQRCSHGRRNSMLSRSGLPIVCVTIIVKSRTPRALTPRSSSVYVHRNRSSGRTPWNQLRKTVAVR